MYSHKFLAHIKTIDKWILLVECIHCYSLVEYQEQLHNCPEVEPYQYNDSLPIKLLLQDIDRIIKLT